MDPKEQQLRKALAKWNRSARTASSSELRRIGDELANAASSYLYEQSGEVRQTFEGY